MLIMTIFHGLTLTVGNGSTQLLCRDMFTGAICSLITNVLLVLFI